MDIYIIEQVQKESIGRSVDFKEAKKIKINDDFNSKKSKNNNKKDFAQIDEGKYNEIINNIRDKINGYGIYIENERDRNKFELYVDRKFDVSYSLKLKVSGECYVFPLNRSLYGDILNSKFGIDKEEYMLSTEEWVKFSTWHEVGHCLLGDSESKADIFSIIENRDIEGLKEKVENLRKIKDGILHAEKKYKTAENINIYLNNFNLKKDYTIKEIIEYTKNINK